MRLLAGDWFGVALWFVGAALLHDLVLLPLYAAADRALVEELARAATGMDRTSASPPPSPVCSCWCGSR